MLSENAHQRMSLVSGEADIQEEDAEDDDDADLGQEEQITSRMPTVYVLATNSNSKNKFGRTMPIGNLNGVSQRIAKVNATET